MANQDFFAGTKTNQENVVNNLNTAFSLHADYDQFGYASSISLFKNSTDIHVV